MPFAFTDPMLLDIGVPAGAASSGSGSAQDSLARLVNAAVAVGIAKSQWFVIPGSRDGVLTLIAQVGAGVVSLKVDLERSLDSGTTWKVIQAGVDVFSGEARIAIAPGGLYRLNVTTFGTPANGATVYGTYVPIG